MIAETTTVPPSPYPPHREGIPAAVVRQGRYRARFATSAADLDALLRLRFEIFNLELGEGLESSFASGRDEDPFDAHCHHLVVEDETSGAIVGTYRMQTAEMAAEGIGFYSAGEFALDALPAEVRSTSVEVGRACIAREHRNRQVLFLLWKGLARYMEANRRRYLFGCCSLTSQDPRDGLALLADLGRRGALHPTIAVPPLPALACDGPLPADHPAPDIPILFRTYLRYGGLVLGAPAIDRAFKTIDYLVLFDVEAMDAESRALFFRP